MPTAQDSLKLMLADYIAPLMKQHGYKRLQNRWGKKLAVPAWRGSRSARWYGTLSGAPGDGRADADWWLIYQVQSSVYSNKGELSFTVNLGAYSTVIADIVGDNRGVKGMPPEMCCHTRLRIGHLLQPPRDEWWTVDADKEPSSVGATLRDVTERLALPYLVSMTSHERMLSTYEQKRGPWREWSGLVLVVHGEAECRRWIAAQARVSEGYKEAWLRRIDSICSGE